MTLMSRKPYPLSQDTILVVGAVVHALACDDILDEGGLDESTFWARVSNHLDTVRNTLRDLSFALTGETIDT